MSAHNYNQLESGGLPLSEKIPLGVMRHSNNHDMVMISQAFREDYENNLDEIADDEISYVFGCIFEK